ncbi:MAG TPA: S9 family peptidase, partial [Tenuifilaceae bacterium]|nr:S9 family peptidase [Tenuifilaceae bacterium]
MNKLIPFTLAVIVMSFQACDRNKIKYPVTKKVDVVDNYFGVNVADPYRWFEDDKAEGLSEWINAQNEITFNYLSKIPYRESLRERLSELWNYSSISTPYIKAGKVFFFKREGLQNQSVFYMQNSLLDEPKVLIDPNTFSEDGTVAISQISISGKADYAAYAIADGGSDWMKIMVRDIKTG